MNSTSLELLNYLSTCSIHYGILDSEGNKVVEVNILNTDNTITTKEMKVADVMYFTEYGTITIPGKYILQKTTTTIKRMIKEKIEEIVRDIFKEEKTPTYIQNQMNQLCLNIQDLIRNNMITYVKNSNKLGQIIHKDVDDNKYLYDLFELRNYIRCIAKFEH